MRRAYLSADRIELQFASKELARAMAESTTADVEALKICIRFSLKYPRCIQSFEKQEIVPKQITCFSDSKLRRMFAEQEEHEFLFVFCPETSSEIYVNNTGGCRSLECRSCILCSSQAAAAVIGCVSMVRDLGVVLEQQGVEVKAKG